jgi:hypothetical protein
MKIKLITLYAGPFGVIQPGEVADLPQAEAQALIAGGYAKPVAEKAVAAAAEAAVPETASLKVVEGLETEALPAPEPASLKVVEGLETEALPAPEPVKPSRRKVK